MADTTEQLNEWQAGDRGAIDAMTHALRGHARPRCVSAGAVL